MSLFPEEAFEERHSSKPPVRMDVIAEASGDYVTHYLVLHLPVRHGPFLGWGKEAEAPEYPEGMLMARQIASVLPRRLGERLRRVLAEGYSPMKSLKLRGKAGA